MPSQKPLNNCEMNNREVQALKEIKYIIAKIKSKLSKNEKETICNYFRKAGMKIGGGVYNMLQYYDN